MAVKGFPINLSLTLNTDGIKRGVQEANRQFSQLASDVQANSEKINISTGSIVKGLAAFAGVNIGIGGIKSFTDEVLRMTGTMEGLQLSFETMLQSKSAADKMMMDVKNFALQTPYTITETAATVKQLIAMNAAGDDVMQTYKALGDVAAGLNVPLQRIAVNFGQVAALGKLQAREVRDFAMAGVPIWDELAAVMGKNVNQIQEMVSAGQVGFPDVLKAFQRMSGEGGRFSDMMIKMNSTVTGQMNRLQDQLEQMFAKIGEANNSIIRYAIGGAATLVENYKIIIDVVTSLATAYGVVWAAQKLWLALDAGIQNSRYAAEITELEKLVLAKRGNMNTDLQQLVVDGKITAEQAKRIAILQSEILAEDKAALQRAKNQLARIQDEKKVTAAVIAETNARIAAIPAVEQTSKKGVTKLIANDETMQTELDTAVTERNTLARRKNSLATQEKIATSRVSAATIALEQKQKDLDTISTNANTVAHNRGRVAAIALGNAIKGLGKAFMASLPTLIIGGIIMAISGLVNAYKNANDARLEYEKGLLDEQIQTNKLVLELRNANLSTEERTKLLDKLRQVNPDIVKGIEDETDAYDILNQRLIEYNAISRGRLSISAAADDNNFEGITERLQKTQEKMREIEARILLDYSNILSEIQKASNDGKIPQAVQKQFDNIISSGLPEPEKLQKIIDIYNAEFNRAISGFEKNPISILSTSINDANGIMMEFNSVNIDLERRQNKVNKSTEELRKKIIELAEVIEFTSEQEKQAFISTQFIQYGIGVDNIAIKVDTVSEKIQSLGNIEDMTVAQLIANADLAKASIDKLQPTDAAFTKWQQFGNEVAAAIEKMKLDGKDTAQLWQWERDAAMSRISNLPMDDPQWAIEDAIITNADKNLLRFGDLARRERDKQREESRKSAEQAVKDREKQIKAQEDAEKQLTETLIDLENERNQAVIDAMQEGSLKERAQIEEDYRLKIQETRQKEAELKEIAIAANIALTPEQTDTYKEGGTIDLAALAERNHKIEDLNGRMLDQSIKDWNEYLREYGTFEEKVQAITELYAGRIADAENEGQRRTLAVERDEEINNLRKKLIEESSLWKKLFSDLDKVPMDALRELYDRVTATVKESNLTIEEQAEILRQLEQAQDRLIDKDPWGELSRSLIRYKEALATNDTAQAYAEWENIKNAASGINGQISELGDALAGFGNIFNSDIGNAINSVTESIGYAITAFNKLGQSGKKSAGDMISGISGVIGIVTTIAGGIASIFEGNAERRREARIAHENELIRQQQGLWESINYQIEKQIYLLDTATGSNYFEEATKALKLYNDALNFAIDNIGQAITQTDKIAFTLANSNIGGRARQMFKDEFSITEDDINNAKIWYPLVVNGNKESLIALKSNEEIWKIIPEHIKETINNIIEYEERLGDLEAQIQKTLLQTDALEIEDTFRQWLRSGKSATDDLGKYFEDTMRNALIESFVMDSLKGRIAEFMDAYKQAADSNGDGQLDLTQEEIDALRGIWGGIIDLAKTEAEAIKTVTGNESNITEERTSASQGLAQASQDSIDAMFGVIVNIENSVWHIKESRASVDNIMRNMLTQVTAIKSNTDRLATIEGYLQRANPILTNISDGITRLNR